jgi:hypothetical protein
MSVATPDTWLWLSPLPHQQCIWFWCAVVNPAPNVAEARYQGGDLADHRYRRLSLPYQDNAWYLHIGVL